MRKSIVAVALAAVGSLQMVPAVAAPAEAPFAGDVRRGEVVVRLPDTPDGASRDIAILAEGVEPAGGQAYSYVRVSVTSCAKRRCTGETYSKILGADEFSVADDGTTGTLDTRFAGMPLVVKWGDECEAAACIRSQGFIFSGGSLTWRRGAEAPADVTIFGLNCQRGGLVMVETTVTSAEYPPAPPEREPARPPRGFSAASGARC